MKKILILLAAVFLLSAPASAFTIHSRSDQGKTVFCTIVASAEEAEDFRAMMNKILAEFFYKIYPRETPAVKDVLELYILQIVVKDKDGEKTVEYFEFPLPRKIIDQILEENSV